MKLKIFPFEKSVVLSEEYVALLQLNNKRLFNRVCNTIYLLTLGQPGEEDILMTEEDKEIDFEEILFLTDLWHFDCNSKKILTKLFSFIEANYKVDAELMQAFQQHLQWIQGGIRESLEELPFNVEMKAMVTLQDVLKMLGVKLARLEGYSLIEKILTIIDIVEQFNLYPAIILCNIKAYLEKNELEELYKHAICCKIKLMIIEYGVPQEELINEKVWYIDEDYEEFLR